MDNNQLSGELPVLEQTVTILSYQCDPRRRLTIPSLFAIFAEAAHYDATRRGWGFEHLLSRNEAWVLIRMLVKINRMPVWGDQVVLRTWPKMMEGVVAYRDFQILGKEREILVAGSSAWSIVDLAKRRPLRISGLEHVDKTLAGQNAVDEKPGKIPWPQNLVKKEEIMAKYSHIDMNYHVNNGRYLEWVLNEFQMDFLLNREVSEISLNFLNEVKPGDTIEIRIPEAEPDANSLSGFITIKDFNMPAFASSFRFHPAF